MVALMVFLTLVACVSVDLLLIQLRKRRELKARTAVAYQHQHDLVFAQDGGKPVDEEGKESTNKEK